MKWIIGKNRTVKEDVEAENFYCCENYTLRKINKNEL